MELAVRVGCEQDDARSGRECLDATRTPDTIFIAQHDVDQYEFRQKLNRLFCGILDRVGLADARVSARFPHHASQLSISGPFATLTHNI